MAVLHTFIGIDPGKKGGIAIVDEYGDRLLSRPLPVTKDGEIDTVVLYDVLKFATDAAVYGVVILEKAQAMPKQGVTSVFTYGVGYGKILAVLELLKLPFEEVRPAVWKKSFGLTQKKTILEKTGKVDSGKYKRAKLSSVALAAELFSSFAPETSRGRKKDEEAEALLLAEYGRRKAGI
jgi:crossover junction endodeoxyribonuclease RuvC